VRALEAFGCAPRALVPDNCSTAVKKALRYDPQFNLSRVNQGGKRDNQDGKFFEGAISEAFSSDLTALEAI
jgi:hypothetical protein